MCVCVCVCVYVWMYACAYYARVCAYQYLPSCCKGRRERRVHGQDTRASLHQIGLQIQRVWHLLRSSAVRSRYRPALFPCNNEITQCHTSRPHDGETFLSLVTGWVLTEWVWPNGWNTRSHHLYVFRNKQAPSSVCTCSLSCLISVSLKMHSPTFFPDTYLRYRGDGILLRMQSKIIRNTVFST